MSQLFPDSSIPLIQVAAAQGLCRVFQLPQTKRDVSCLQLELATGSELPQQEEGRSQSVGLSPGAEIALSPVSPSDSVGRGEQDLFSPG